METATGWTGGNGFTLGIYSLLPETKGLCWEQTKKCISDWFSFLIPTNTAGSLLVEMVATATVGHVLLARIGALRVDARVPDRASRTDTYTLIDIYSGKDGEHVVRPGGLPQTQQAALQRNPTSPLLVKQQTGVTVPSPWTTSQPPNGLPDFASTHHLKYHHPGPSSCS